MQSSEIASEPAALRRLLGANASVLSPMNRRRLFGYLRPHVWRMVVALASLLVSAGFGLMFPQLIVKLLEGIEQTRDMRLLNAIGVALLGVFLLQSLFGFLEAYLLAIVGERVVTELRTSLYRHMQQLSAEFFAKNRVGDLISRLSNDVGQVRAVLTTNVGLFVGQLATLLGALALMLSMNVRLTLFILGLLPPMVLVGLLFSKKIESTSAAVQDQLADSTVIAEEGLRGVQVVKSFGAEAHEVTRYVQAMARTLRTSLQVARYNAQFSSFMNFLALCSIAAVIWYGGREVIAARLTAAKVTGFLIYGIIIAQSLAQLASLFGQLSAALGGIQRVFELLDTRPGIQDSKDAVTLRECQGHITLSNVSFGYVPGTPVLRDVSLDIRPGEILALVGPSGGGKSTLFNLIPRLYDVGEGSVNVDGQDVRALSQQSLRQHIAIVPQETLLFGGSIRDNLRYGRPDATDDEIVAAARVANAHEFIMRLPQQYDTALGERGLNLSGGQRQRIAIARAVLKNPRILLLDEATSALDSESEGLVQEALNRLMQQERTTLIVAHRLSTIKVAHRIAVVDAHGIAELGTHDELMAKAGLYARLYALQFRKDERIEMDAEPKNGVRLSAFEAMPEASTL